jgi:hypothetical protein
LYGGGGGGSGWSSTGAVGGVGANGVIVVTYTPAVTINWTFADGFDAYAGVGDILLGWWDSNAASNSSLAPGRRNGSQAFSVGSAGVGPTKASGSNDAVHHFAMSFYDVIAFSGTSANLWAFINIYDGSTLQCAINFAKNGAITLSNGVGTVIATFGDALSFAQKWYGLEFEVVINATTGSFRLRKYGNTTDDFVATGLNTKNSANAYANKISISGTQSGSVYFDDLIWQSGSATGNWLGDLACYVRRPVSDQSVQFTPLAAAVNFEPIIFAGTSAAATSTNFAVFTPFVAPCAGTLNSVAVNVGTTGAGPTFKFTLYSDAGNAPSSIIASANNLTIGATGWQAATFSSPPTLVAGTQYWIGQDISATSGTYYQGVNQIPTKNGALPYYYALAYASFPPSTPTPPPGASLFPGMCLQLNITGTPANAPFVADVFEDGANSYVSSATVGQNDLYGLDTLGVTPTAIPLVVTKGLFNLDSGARSASVQNKSGSTTSQGASTALTAATWKWIGRYDLVDPSTSAAWTATGVNNLQIGPIITA